MRSSKRAFFKRGGAACAVAAVLIGGTFAAGTATAAPSADSGSPSINQLAATPAAAAPATDLPGGLAEAVKRDLGKTLEEFKSDGELAAKASDVQEQLQKVDPQAVVSVSNGSISATTSASDAATAAAGASGINVTAPAQTANTVATVDSALAAYAKAFGVSKLQSVMSDASGNIVIRTGDVPSTSPTPAARSFAATLAPSAQNFAAGFSNVIVKAADGPAKPMASNDVTNGQGYVSRFDGGAGTRVGSCSIGWNGFNAQGQPAIITAGHCANDGHADITALTDPTKEPAVGGPGYEAIDMLGAFGASQFGGPGNTPYTGDPTNPGNFGTDVAVIDGINPVLNQLPKVTDWTTPESPRDSGPLVTGVSRAVAGTEVCKSGRTTGWTCGVISEVGFFAVRGLNFDTNPNDLRLVRGFGSSELRVRQGDSGGSMISGTQAVGIVSAGIDNVISYGADLQLALDAVPGYTVKIALNTPVVTTSAPVYRQGAITGTVAGAPAGTVVVVTVDGVTSEVPVGEDGTWSATAPNAFGTFPMTAQTKNGFSTSEPVNASIDVVKETLTAPAFTSPALNGTVAGPVTAITGTGTPGATVNLTGDVTATAVVDANGNWSVDVSPALSNGAHTITAVQTLSDWNDSPATANSFSVVPAAPGITSPSNGQEFAHNDGPASVTGTNIAGATVTVTVNGSDYSATVTDGTWSVPFGAALTSGQYTATAVQTVGGVKSLATTVTFTVLNVPAPPATDKPVDPSNKPTVKPVPSQTPTQAPADGSLARTGASNTMLLLGGAGGFLLLGGATFMLLRRRIG